MWTEINISTAKRTSSASLYLMDCDLVVKIGISTDVPSRARTLQKTSGRRLKAVYVLDGDYDARSAENHLHRLFSADRLEGEWFAVRAEKVLAAEVSAPDFPQRKSKTGGMTDEEREAFLKRMFPEPSASIPVSGVAGIVTAIALAAMEMDPDLTFDGVVKRLAAVWSRLSEDDFIRRFEETYPAVHQRLAELLEQSQH